MKEVLKKECKKTSKWDYYPHDVAGFMERHRNSLRRASVHETMGPSFKPIIWITYASGKKSPFVFKN